MIKGFDDKHMMLSF